MMPAGRGLRHGRRPPAGRHQTGCGRIPTVANASAGMAEAPASCRRAGDRWSNTGGRARSDDGKSRADRIFQPSNGMTHRFQSPKIPTRFRWAPHSCSGLRGTSPREGRRWRRAATIKALAPNPTVVDCQRVEAMSYAEREPKGSATRTSGGAIKANMEWLHIGGHQQVMTIRACAPKKSHAHRA